MQTRMSIMEQTSPPSFITADDSGRVLPEQMSRESLDG